MPFNTHNALGSVDDRDVQDNAATTELAETVIVSLTGCGYMTDYN